MIESDATEPVDEEQWSGDAEQSDRRPVEQPAEQEAQFINASHVARELHTRLPVIVVPHADCATMGTFARASGGSRSATATTQVCAK